MPYFTYKNGYLHGEEIALQQIIDAVGTPFYCYSQQGFTDGFLEFKNALEGTNSLICYAVKANSNLAVLEILARLGAGADIVSGAELKRALQAGIRPENIVFSGVGKSDDEIKAALTSNILQFNVESLPELDAISAIAQKMNKVAPIAIRVNPDVAAVTHEKISTGKRGDKFGIDWSETLHAFRHARTLPNLHIKGIACHIGSQITSLDPFATAYTRIGELLQHLRSEGFAIEQIDLGGGLGIRYQDDQADPATAQEFAAMVKRITAPWNVRLLLEPGRQIAGNSGIIVTSIRFIKQAGHIQYAIVDAAMNDLARPSLYDSYHDIKPIIAPLKDAPTQTYSVVGPVCETGDILAKDRQLPRLNQGDFLAIISAGAYGASMSSTYNSRFLIPEILIHKNQWAVIRKRQTYEELVSLEQKLPW